MGNRIVGNFKVKLGQAPGEKEETTLDKEGKRILNDLRTHYKKITDGVKVFPTQNTFVGDGVVSTYTELCLLAQYLDLEGMEQKHFSRLNKILIQFPIYNDFLEPCKGVGPAMAGVILSEMDVYKARHASSFWKYAGLDVGSDGKGRSRKEEHLIEVEYAAKDGETKTRRAITFNPFLKTKLVGVLGSSILKAVSYVFTPATFTALSRYDISAPLLAAFEPTMGKTTSKATARKILSAVEHEQKQEPGAWALHLESMLEEARKIPQNKYANLYYDYKHRMEQHATYKDVTPGHRHNMATRYAIKIFLLDLWVAWRTLEGLPVSQPYYVAKLSMPLHAA